MNLDITNDSESRVEGTVEIAPSGDGETVYTDEFSLDLDEDLYERNVVRYNSGSYSVRVETGTLAETTRLDTDESTGIRTVLVDIHDDGIGFGQAVA